MSIVTIREGTASSLSKWAANIGITSSEVKSLVDFNILRRNDQGGYDLVFVGIAIFKDRLLFAPPKFHDVSPLDLPEVLRILRRYFARSRRRTPVSDWRRDPEFDDAEVLREFDAVLGLRDWFFAHGLYRRDQAQVSDRGRPHWVRTIAKCMAVFTRGGVIYPSVIAERREGVLNDVSALQAGVLRQLLRRYGLPVPGIIQHAEFATGIEITTWPLERDARTYYERRLDQEQRSVYRTETLQLLKLLRAALDTRFAGLVGQPQVYGTTAFYSVWEDACRTGIGCDQPPESISMLGQPAWWAQDIAGNKKRYDQTQSPDFLVARNEWLLILDAKYYYPFPQARPGGPDIIKQVYYAESLQHRQANVLSIFLLPLPNTAMPRFLGYATVEGAHRDFGTVEAWGIDPVSMLSTYPLVSANRANCVIDAILRGRRHVTEFLDKLPSDIRA